MARTIVTALVTAGFLAAGLSVTISAEAEAPHYRHNPYPNYSYKDLVAAATGVSKRAEEDVGVKGDTALQNAAGQFTIFWPKAFPANMSGAKASDLSHLKEDMIAIEEAAIEGECQI
jgi:hypothetical protein